MNARRTGSKRLGRSHRTVDVSDVCGEGSAANGWPHEKGNSVVMENQCVRGAYLCSCLLTIRTCIRGDMARGLPLPALAFGCAGRHDVGSLNHQGSCTVDAETEAIPLPFLLIGEGK